MNFMMALGVLVLLIAAIGLIYTYVVGRNQKYLQGEFDTKLNEKVQAHPYIRNPVLLACLFGFLALLAIVAYMAALR